MNKNIEKINTKKEVKWPTTQYFTIDDLIALNTQFVLITLRVRLTKAIEEDGKVAEIGSIPGGKGRPKKVFALTPVTKGVLDKAESNGINLVDKAREKFQYVVGVETVSPQPVNLSTFKTSPVRVS